MDQKVRARRVNNASVSGTSKSGFTLIEIVVALAIIALLATAISPVFSGRLPRAKREEFINKLSALTQFGWQQALITHTAHRLYFNFDKHTITLQVATDKKDSDGEPVCLTVKPLYVQTQITIPEQVRVQQFILEGFDEMSRFTGKSTGQVWFYIMPEGLTQAVIINMVDTQDTLAKKAPRPIGLVLNPFSARFGVYDTFQK